MFLLVARTGAGEDDLEPFVQLFGSYVCARTM